MKKQLITIIAFLFSSALFAQGVYNNGAKIVVGTGITLYISGNYQNETNGTGGSIDLSGTLKIGGNLINNATGDVFSTVVTGSKVELNGTVPQTIGGTTSAIYTFPDLTINNSAGIVIAKDMKVNGNLTFTTGLVNIGSANLTFGPASTVAGTPSATSMIVATGSGQVLKSWSGAGSFTFPVGDNTGTAEYSPVTLNFTTGTFALGAIAGVNLVNAAFTDPFISGSYLSRYWNVTQTGITGFTCNADFNYPIADVVGTESEIYGVRITPSPVTLFSPANTALHQLTATGLTSFGTFTGALGQRTLSLKLYLEGLYIGGGMMKPAISFDGVNFVPKWGSTIADHITVELHDAANYLNVIRTVNDVPLNTDGTVSVTLPSNYNGSYYVAIKHRNSIETVVANPISFSTQIITYDLSSLALKAFGNNLKAMAGAFVIYVGDVSSMTTTYPASPIQDGVIDQFDDYYTYQSGLGGRLGYVAEDVNGDGVVDLFDTYLVYSNFLTGIYAMKP